MPLTKSGIIEIMPLTQSGIIEIMPLTQSGIIEIMSLCKFNYNSSEASFIISVITRAKRVLLLLICHSKQWFNRIITRTINRHFYYQVIFHDSFYVSINTNRKNEALNYRSNSLIHIFHDGH